MNFALQSHPVGSGLCPLILKADPWGVLLDQRLDCGGIYPRG